MLIDDGQGTTKWGPGVSIKLTGEEVATAIDAFLVGSRVHISGPRTIKVNGDLCKEGYVYVDPSGFVIFNGKKYSGRGNEQVNFREVKLRKCSHCNCPEAQVCRPIGGGWICQNCFQRGDL